jgi:hypothetical protein
VCDPQSTFASKETGEYYAQASYGLFEQILRKKTSWFPLHYDMSAHSTVTENYFLASCGLIGNLLYSPNLVPDVFSFTTAKSTLKGRVFQHAKYTKKNANSFGRV